MGRTERVLGKLTPEMLEKAENKAVTYFACRPTAKPQCKCGKNKMTSTCHYPLRGSKEGQTCGKLLCELCGETIGNATYCRPHARIVRKENDK